MEFEKWVSDEQAIVKMIAGDYSGSAMYPPFILRERLAFPPRNSYIIDSDVTRSLRYNIRASQMVQENTHYFRNLLTFYGITEEVYTVNRGNAGGANRFVRIKLDNDDQDYRNKNTRLIELFINDKKIPNVDIFQVSQYGMDIIKIPLSKFRVNETDIIKIHKYPVINAHQKYYRFNVREFATLYTDEFTEVSSISSLYGDLGYYDDIEDLEVFIEGTSETMRNSIQLHVPGASLYYRKVPKNDANYTLRLMRSPVTGDDALCLKIPSGSCIPNNTNIMIVNPLFHTSKTFNLTELASSTDCRIALNEVQNGVAIPFTTGRFLVKVYLNGKLLMNGYDYREVNQDTHDGIGSASIVFSKRLVRGDRVEVVCTGTGNKVIATYPVIPRENIFGYIYFATLPVPFSLKYLSLMVNGIMLTEDDVEVYTDRLIRLKGRAKPPFYSVILLTRLKYGLGAFERYIGDFLHYPNPFDSYMRTLSHNIIYDAIDLSGEENNGNILDIIHDDSTLTDEEETLLNDYENGAYVPPEVEPWDADHISYMDRLAWDFNRNANEISKYFDSNYYKKITSDAYVVSLLALVDRDLLKTHSIVLDANGHRGIMRENFVADANRYARTKHKTAQLITRLIKQHSIPTLDANMTYEQYEHPLFRKYLYPFDAVCFDANICTKDYNIAQHIVADANSVSEPV
jgi:hypothetical protein